MYLRVTRGRVDPTKSDEATGLVSAIVAAIQQLPGCRGVQVGMDRSTRERIAEALQPLQALGWHGEDAEIYEVTHETVHPPRMIH